MSQQQDTNLPKSPKPHVGQVVFSILAAAFGVQSHKNRERDFSGGNLFSYIIVSLIFFAIFVGGLIFLVNFLLRNVN